MNRNFNFKKLIYPIIVIACMGSVTYSLSAGKRHADKELGGDLNRRRIEGPAPYVIKTFGNLINCIKSGNSLTNLNIDPTIINSKDNHEQTPLHYAVLLNPKAIPVLVNNGADVNIKDNNERTPLHYAVQFNPKAVPALLDKGADPNIKDNDDNTPLHDAVELNPNAVPALLDKGADPNITNNNGRTPLHHAAVFNPEVIPALLDKGADVNAIYKEEEEEEEEDDDQHNSGYSYTPLVILNNNEGVDQEQKDRILRVLILHGAKYIYWENDDMPDEDDDMPDENYDNLPDNIKEIKRTIEDEIYKFFRSKEVIKYRKNLERNARPKKPARFDEYKKYTRMMDLGQPKMEE